MRDRIPQDELGQRESASIESGPPIVVAIVGGGPRGVATTARLIADRNAVSPGESLIVHLIDAVRVGGGRTWRDDQVSQLLNNTYCAETTVFADESVDTVGAVMTGPSLSEWARDVVPGAIFPAWVVDEAATLSDWSYPSRAIQGVYFRWALDRVTTNLPADIRVVEHRATVVDLGEDACGRQVLTLADGNTLLADTVVLAQGLLTSADSPEVKRMIAAARSTDLVYLPPGMPSERDWDLLPAGEDVIVTGLGANFFDVIGLLFEGRGGAFVRDADGVLRYQASGREPRVIAGSRHGLPYRAKSYFPSGMPTLWPLERFSASLAAELAVTHEGLADVDFRSAVWPLILKDFEDAYRSTAITAGTSADFSWDNIVFPAEGRVFENAGAWDAFLDDYFAQELAGVHDPDLSPRKAVHRAMEAARRRLSGLVLAGVFTPASFVGDLKEWFFPASLVIASGPPPERLERLVALRRAGLVRLLPPGLRVEILPDGFVAHSETQPGVSVKTRAFAEARMRLGDLRSTDDPLVTSLLASGQARFHSATTVEGDRIESNTLDVTRDGFLLIDANGAAHPRRIVLGPPAGDIQWNAAIGAIPHTGDKMIVGVEAAAVRALRNGAVTTIQLDRGDADAAEARTAETDSRSAAATSAS